MSVKAMALAVVGLGAPTKLWLVYSAFSHSLGGGLESEGKRKGERQGERRGE